MEEADLKILSARLRAARKDAGMSTHDLAARVGAHHSYIARIETGERRPSAEWLQKIATALRIDPRELLVHVGVNPSSVLPKPREYFTRILGVTEEGADMMLSVLEYIQKQKEKPSEETERERHGGAG